MEQFRIQVAHNGIYYLRSVKGQQKNISKAWVKKNDDWVCILSTESDLRDKKTQNASNYSLKQIRPYRFGYSFSSQIHDY
jgi:hypothetical protein